MRIKAIEIVWFRGAANAVSLEPESKSMVVYGANGSGKSSFVDAVEYVLHSGRIRHLAHEYSGKRQEKAIINTHTPIDRKTELQIRFKDATELKTVINRTGTSTSSGAEAVAMATWEYSRTVLRQDEVATFIWSTKGDKYSALLPLLGLYQMEVAAENLRQLAKSVEQQSKLSESKVALKGVETKRKEIFGAATDDQIVKSIEDLHTKYCPDKAKTADVLSQCMDIEATLYTRMTQFSADQKKHLALQGAANLNLKEHVGAVRSASLKLAGAAEPLIVEKLEVLQSADAFVDKLEPEKEVKCPACGRPIPVQTFQAHIKAEKEHLKKIIDTFDSRKAAIGTLCDTLKSLNSNLGKADVQSWRDNLAKGALAESFARLDDLNVEALRASCGEDGLKEIEAKLLPLIDAAAAASKDAPPDVEELSIGKQTVEAAKAVVEAREQAEAVAGADALIAFLGTLEQGTREEIRMRSQKVIDEISSDIRAMWKILHPGEAIDDVHLYLPEDADKAIDIGLKFFGFEQDSPRLTLSEGHRNSLGLCIFLAMAKREIDNDRPLFMDDVVISFDRTHRGMIVELLEKMFSGRQVIILTHDREWYTELRQQLDGGNWIFKALLPYETPEIGIRWSHKTTTFADASAQLKERPDAAGNDVRKIMDVELALIAERLKVRMPYLRSDKNDKRMAHDFLERFVGDGKKCLQKKTVKVYETYSEAIDAFDKADRLLVSWANRSSHSFDVVHPEATKLIDVCEKALEYFKCSSCGKGVWFADAVGSEWVQCHCGEIRWRYGKA